MTELFVVIGIIGAFLLGMFVQWRRQQETCKVTLRGDAIEFDSVVDLRRGNAYTARDTVINQNTGTGWPRA